MGSYEFPLESVQHYPEEIIREIEHGVSDLRRIGDLKTKFLMRPSKSALLEQALHSESPIERDQAVWQLIAAFPGDAADVLIQSITSAPTRKLKLSGLLALVKLAHIEEEKILTFLGAMAAGDMDDDIEITEWARVLTNDLRVAKQGYESLDAAASGRDFDYDPEARFDATMPLVFHCHALTRVGPTTWHTVISPEWFSVVFGDAKALIRSETYMTNLVLEKTVPGLHADGSPHYEHFGFSGRSDKLSSNVYRHNYWAKLYRPYYTSGKVERVSDSKPVMRSIAQTFCRTAVTSAPERYRTAKGPVPESVRGMFFGYGHIEPSILATSRLNIRAGEFQLTPQRNPATGKLANTYFFGTFFGKTTDLDGDGRLDINTMPVHCDVDGRLDYDGDGNMAPDPVAPLDWTGLPG
ncbi:MAG: hypothetical protein MJA32_00475 [Proteobacteria bacterium]|nr:hypothetical protein [Pseudomonadota bacterium]